ncbi:MAG: (Fe-S)-binding protein [Candidatus Pacearchaeota archaeon]
MGLFSFFKKSNRVYYPGCRGFFKFPEQFELYKKIFEKLSIDFKIIDKKICCGLPAYEAGYEQEARKLARRNFEIFKEENISEIITPCPACYKMFLQQYSEFLPEWNIKVFNIWGEILKKIEEKPFLIKNKVDDVVTVQDSCYLGRYCDIYNEPRLILELFGYDIKEMKNNKENAFCTGGCGGLSITNIELADKCAKEILIQAKRINVNKIIVFSLEDYKLLKRNSKNSNIKIFEFSEILADSLGIKKLENREIPVEIEEVDE